MQQLSAGLRLALLPHWPQGRLTLPQALVWAVATSSALIWVQPGLSASTAVSQVAQAPAPTTPNPTAPSDRVSRPTLRLGSQGEAVNELQALLKLLGFYPGLVTGQFQEPTQEAVKQFQAAAGLTPDGIVGSATWSQLFPTPPAEANPPTTASTPPTSTPAASTSAPSTASTATAPASTPTAARPANPGAGGNSTGGNRTTSGNAAPAASSSSAQPARSTSSATDRPVLRPGMEGPAVTRLQERLRALGFYRGTVDGVFGTQTENAVKQAQRHFNLEPDGIVGSATWRAILP